jgi:hypothetical protein
MNGKIKRMIIGYARRLSSSWEPRQNVKKNAKVAPALHRCSKCGSLNYEGDSQKTFDKYVQQFPNDTVNFKRIELDHIKPVIGVSGWTNWDEFFESLFCEEDNFRPLCNSCHQRKTNAESNYRKDAKRKSNT